MGEQFKKTAPIECDGGCTFFNEGYTLKLILVDPVKGEVVVDSATGKSDNITGAWSNTFQSTEQNPYPAGTYYVKIYETGSPTPDAGVQITLID